MEILPSKVLFYFLRQMEAQKKRLMPFHQRAIQQKCGDTVCHHWVRMREMGMKQKSEEEVKARLQCHVKFILLLLL